jgi:catenin beta 1
LYILWLILIAEKGDGIFSCFNHVCVGYDQIPIDSMQGLEIGSHHGAGGGGGSTYGPIDAMDVGGPDSSDLNFDHLDELPQPPQDNNQVAAWYDTDL